MALLWFLFRQARTPLLLAMLAGMASGGFGVLLIAVLNTALQLEATARLPFAYGFAGVCLLMLLSRLLSALLLIRLGQATVFKLRLQLSRRILAAPLRSLQRLGAPRLLANLTEDVAVLGEAFAWLPVVCGNATIVIGCLVYIGWLNSLMLALICGVIAIGLLSYQLVSLTAMRRLQLARECEDSLYRHFRGLTEGVKELKLHQGRRETFLVEILQSAAAGSRSHHIAGMSRYVLAANWGHSLFYVVIGMVVFALGQWLPLPADTLRGCSLAVLYMMGPWVSIFDGMGVLARARVSLAKIQQLGQELQPDGETIAATSTTSQLRAKSLQLQQVTHRYSRDHQDFVLGPLNLRLSPGELVFLVGGNGSGKTTLALLLAGLYAPEKGLILLGGEPVTEASRESYRQHFSAVFSDFYLFESLLGFSGPELDKKARDYLRRLQLGHKVKIEDGAFSTLNLSQGQRKRLALLVAYLEDRPFYVFDEWAADQDPVFKKIFYTEILPSLKARGKTVLVITHDEAYFQVADRCLKLEDGILAEMEATEFCAETEAAATSDIDLKNTYVEVSP